MKKLFAIAALLCLVVSRPADANIQNIPTPNLWIGSGTATKYLQSERAMVLLSEKGNKLTPE